MFLKRLEVVGFKSFAEQINIDFVQGVTAVVGPNGSGKSNISDSIRWVLGEQSAKSLRGTKMEDIIFAGSDGRKALNYAEVSLILDNEDQHLSIDYSEVSVTRRVYRSGESEYMINKQACRLKDIVDLFLDSGLGREAYSIIGQGKVEEILSNKAEDRRVIFEEAAGVLKYKNRKMQAEKRLLETQDNLYRVEDILHELEGQVEPLGIQASIAKDYLHKREELKEVDIALLVYEIDELHETWTSQKESLQLLMKSYEEKQQAQEEMEQLRIRLRDQTNVLSSQFTKLQEELLMASEELEKSEGKKQVLKERRKNANQNKDQLDRTIKDKSNQLITIKEEWQEEQSKLKVASEKLKELERTVQQKQEIVERSETDVEEEIERLKADYIEGLNEQASIRNERRYLEEQLRQQELKQEKLLNENKDILKNRHGLSDDLERAKEAANKLQLELEKKGEEFREQQKKLEQTKDRYHKKEAQLYETYQIAQRIQSRADLLEEMQADFSGFFQGVKEILKERSGKLTGILGAVAEIIQVPKDYETALEIALGGSSQHVVTESEADARRAIQFLKQNRIGRATFLPLPVMKPKTIPDFQLNQLKQHEAFVGVASSLLTYEKKYKDVIASLLGNVVIAHTLQGANELAKLTGHRFRIVTLEGDVVNPGGSMTGGSVKQKQTPLLGRKRELEDLKEKLTKLKSVTKQYEAEVKTLKQERSDLENLVEQLRTDGEIIRQSLLDAKSKIKDFEREVEKSQDEFSRFDRDKEGFAEEIKRLKDRLHKLEDNYQVTSKEAERLEQRVKLLEQQRQKQRQSHHILQQELVNDKIELAAAKERFVSLEGQAKRLGSSKKQLEEELLELKDHFELLVGEMSDRTNGEFSIEERIEQARQQKAILTRKIGNMKSEREQVNQSYVELEHKLKEEQGTLQYLSEQCRKIEVNVNRMDVELDNRLTHLQEEYELSFQAAKENHHLAMEPDEARAKVKLIKLAIEELGTVNIGAIEEYERVKERFDFLSEQQKDLQTAKSTLHDVITEMDEEMTKRFYDSYIQIRSHFQTVFRELFGGGQADLVLTNPDDLLMTGVEIVAKPPGKKMQNLALLSGGERSLTAIALLFAILKVRPVPFCVLDEVEAALDEANVSRFAHFLKDFSKATQFIVITHRKGTMEEADVLYGITMQESGVSRLVSVKFEETKELLES
ncbi:chromosome segregation protein SMC [Halalkalibacter akibai]|uniref:Chromosome partition protein Smc n=1 Tax=Halalkalibacter akibai (strain ATCC 43226 / DSM 21942 / CIP 109018 / JCM 9157 / 1139) TaxID=1236973 RepID=W4QPV4_HALA3|nr:chromosome segregation protein SMC [Halalkalibacter akibai]GAE33922.1 chromosome partition protein smc [Halalkalibacter akibai JCM 9157]